MPELTPSLNRPALKELSYGIQIHTHTPTHTCTESFLLLWGFILKKKSSRGTGIHLQIEIKKKSGNKKKRIVPSVNLASLQTLSANSLRLAGVICCQFDFQFWQRHIWLLTWFDLSSFFFLFWLHYTRQQMWSLYLSISMYIPYLSCTHIQELI